MSRFYGIVITMYFNEAHHSGRPHFHAEYGEAEATFDIETLESIAGRLPPRANRMVLRWARLHRQELRINWQRVREKAPPIPIDPLR